MRSRLAFGILTAILLCAPEGNAGTLGGETVATSEAGFLLTTAAVHAAEIKLGELARRRAQSADIRGLGNLTAEMHFRGLAQVVPLLVRTEGFQERAFAAQSYEYDQLLALKDSAFDAEYWRVVLSHQQSLINTLKQRVTTGQNDDITNYARSTLGMVSQVFTSARAVPNPYPVIPK